MRISSPSKESEKEKYSPTKAKDDGEGPIKERELMGVFIARR